MNGDPLQMKGWDTVITDSAADTFAKYREEHLKGGVNSRVLPISSTSAVIVWGPPGSDQFDDVLGVAQYKQADDAITVLWTKV